MGGDRSPFSKSVFQGKTQNLGKIRPNVSQTGVTLHLNSVSHPVGVLRDAMPRNIPERRGKIPESTDGKMHYRKQRK